MLPRDALEQKTLFHASAQRFRAKNLFFMLPRDALGPKISFIKLSDSMKVYFNHKTLSDVDSFMYNNFEYHFLLTGDTIPFIRINSLKLLDRKGAILPTYLYYQYSYSVKRGKLIAIEQIPFDIPPPPGTNGRYKAISIVLHSVKPNSSTPFLKVIWDISIGDQQIADTIEYRFKKYYDMRPNIF